MLMVLLPGCSVVGGADSEEITVGAVTFAENQIVAEMYAQVLEDAGYRIDRLFNFHNREALQPEMRAGSVDVAPEYLASLLTTLDPEAEPSSDPDQNVSLLGPLLDEIGLDLLEPSEANNTNALVVDSETAARLDLTQISDLSPVASRLVLGGPPECPERPFCLQGLREVYGLEFREFRPLDAGGPLTIAALSSETIDVALLFTTSGVILERNWVVLEDDRELQAADNITPVVRSDIRTDDLENLLTAVSDTLTTERMTALNARVEVRNQSFREVAGDFLQQQGLLEDG